MGLFGTKTGKAPKNVDAAKSARGFFGFSKKEPIHMEASSVPEESSRVSPGLTDFSVDLEALSRSIEPAAEDAPEAAALPLLKAASDAHSTNLRQLAQLTLEGNEEESHVSQPCTEAEDAALAAAAQGVKDRAADLEAAARGAKAYRAACLSLAALGRSVVEVLEAQEPLAADPALLDGVAVLLGKGASLAASCGAADWLLAAASPERGVGDALAALHSDVLAGMKGLESGPGGPRLPAPDSFPDGSKSLQRRLRQLGAGSLAAGFQAVAGAEEVQRELAALLGCKAEDVKLSAAHVAKAGLVSGDDVSIAADEAAGADRAALERMFAAYAGFGVRDSASGAAPELDSFRAAKLAREAGLLGPRLRAQELDVLFAAAARTSTSRRLSFEGFLKLLSLVADKKGVPLAEVAGAVASLQGPVNRGTTPEPVKLHDDKSLYTGVYSRGMSVSGDSPDLSRLVDRGLGERATRRPSFTSAASSRRASSMGVGAAPPLSRTTSDAKSSTPRGGPNLGDVSPRPCASSGKQEERDPSRACTPEVSPATDRTLRDVWSQFAAFGRTSANAGSSELTMDSAQLQKLCRDCGLLGRGLTATRVDLVYRAAAGKGARRITFKQFKGLLPRLAEARGCPESELAARVASCQGPSRNNTTTPEAVRLSDRSNFTGVAATAEKERAVLAAISDHSGRRATPPPFT